MKNKLKPHAHQSSACGGHSRKRQVKVHIKTACAVAINVYEGRITSPPGGRSAARNNIDRPTVALATVKACFTFRYEQTRSSSFFAKGPRFVKILVSRIFLNVFQEPFSIHDIRLPYYKSFTRFRGCHIELAGDLKALGEWAMYARVVCGSAELCATVFSEQCEFSTQMVL